MSPVPRSTRYAGEDNGQRKLKTRLDLLIALIALQIILSVGIWLDLPHERQEPKQKPADTSEPLTEEREGQIQTDEQSFDSMNETPAQSEPAKMTAEVEWSNIKIDVLNGCGVPRMAARTRDWLERNGYSVRTAENADRHDYAKSLIKDRSGNLNAAFKLAGALNIDPDQVDILEGAPSEVVDLTLVIGKDYKKLPLDE